MRAAHIATTALAAVAGMASAKTVTHDFRVGWVTANPDGRFDRPTIGVNNAWPPPLITASVGDDVVVNMHNALGNASASLHFHGLFQNGTNHMDGAAAVTQCAVPPGSSFTYRFRVEQPGTYWYHAHNDGLYPEGLRGPVVIHDPEGPYEGKYDEEVVLTFSDWYHRPVRELVKEFIHYKNPTGAEPVPQSALINDTQNLKVPVRPGKTYLVRMANVAAFAGMQVWFEGHTVRVVEVDGVWTEESEADVLYIAAAQRYSVLLTTKKDAKAGNFPIVAAMDQELFDVIPDDLQVNVTGWLVYDEAKPLPEPALRDEIEPFDDMELVPRDAQALFEHADHQITFDVKMDNLGDGANYAFFNDVTYVTPKVPSLYTVLSAGGPTNASIPAIYGSYTNTHVLKNNHVIEIVINNMDDGEHPFHLHGHNFQVVTRSEPDAGPFDSSPGSTPAARDSLRRTLTASTTSPMRRDTVVVHSQGHAVVRFRADNPGVWLFHCHIEWHMDQGLIATLVSSPEVIASRSTLLDIPRDHIDACRASGRPTAGNAAGNTEDLLDLRGENRPPRPLPEGFTTKGYIALVCSCLAAFMGMASIYYYGTLPEMGKRADEDEQSD